MTFTTLALIAGASFLLLKQQKTQIAKVGSKKSTHELEIYLANDILFRERELKPLIVKTAKELELEIFTPSKLITASTYAYYNGQRMYREATGRRANLTAKEKEYIINEIYDEIYESAVYFNEHNTLF